MNADPAAPQQTPSSLSNLARQLTRLTALLFLVLGLVLFIAPGWASPNFLWKISPFVAMTMGGWYLGDAFLAWEAARVWKWSSVYPSMLQLWLFSFLEGEVLLLHTSNLRLGAVLGWPYIIVLAVASVGVLAGIVDWVRLRPRAYASTGERIYSALRVGLVLFALAVFIIAAFPLLGYGKSGTVFPEPLTVFTLSAFGVFYLSISLGTVPLFWEKHLTPVLVYARTGLPLLYIITLAALINLDIFDFANRPGGLIYIGVYVVVGVLVTYLAFRHRAIYPRVESPAPGPSAAPL